ncbi:MAG: FeoB-associated Cys-rich membrane protein [Eubacterium sp.]
MEVFMEKYVGTFIVLLILIFVVCLVVRSMINDKKKGKSLQCGGDCKHCGGHCH